VAYFPPNADFCRLLQVSAVSASYVDHPGTFR
jgi:hypothetical protein